MYNFSTHLNDAPYGMPYLLTEWVARVNENWFVDGEGHGYYGERRGGSIYVDLSVEVHPSDVKKGKVDATQQFILWRTNPDSF